MLADHVKAGPSVCGRVHTSYDEREFHSRIFLPFPASSSSSLPLRFPPTTSKRGRTHLNSPLVLADTGRHGHYSIFCNIAPHSQWQPRLPALRAKLC